MHMKCCYDHLRAKKSMITHCTHLENCYNNNLSASFFQTVSKMLSWHTLSLTPKSFLHCLQTHQLFESRPCSVVMAICLGSVFSLFLMYHVAAEIAMDGVSPVTIALNPVRFREKNMIIYSTIRSITAIKQL